MPTEETFDPWDEPQEAEPNTDPFFGGDTPDPEPESGTHTVGMTFEQAAEAVRTIRIDPSFTFQPTPIIPSGSFATTSYRPWGTPLGTAPESVEVATSEGPQQMFPCARCGAYCDDPVIARDHCIRTCAYCGGRWHNEEDALNCCTTACNTCGERYRRYDAAVACCLFKEESILDTTGMYLVGLDGSVRTPRQISIEQEMDDGMGPVSAAFEKRGWPAESHPHSAQDRHWVFLKDDGTLSDEGVEIVYSRLLLNREEDSRKLSEALHVVRNLKEQGHVRSGWNAGTHIHVSATDNNGRVVNADDVTSVYGAFCHIEGALYRLAAAGWAHHRVEEGGDYCHVLMKKDKLRTGDIPGFTRNRYHGLNFSRIMDGARQCARNCGCGAAMMGAWDSCSCYPEAWNQATFEWRLFNATTKPQTMHAWLIVAAAVTERALRENCSQLPIHGYDTHFNAGSVSKQIEWLLECPMTDDEREVVKDAISRSPRIAALI